MAARVSVSLQGAELTVDSPTRVLRRWGWGHKWRESGAEYSPCRRYRYALWRVWDAARPGLLCVCLNPSTATEEANDPTVARLERRARAWGYGAVHVANLFGLRSTQPGELYRAADPVGPGNDAAILAAARWADTVVCGWGNHGRLNGRGREVAALLRAAGIPLHALAVTGKGEPGHPLYLGYALEPVAWRA